jgi:hypothetical protein
MRTEPLTESQDTVLALEPSEARDLEDLGRRLASRKAWWGDGGGVAEKGTSVIRVRPVGDGRWSVRVSDAVGLVSIGSLQLLIEPKIPTSHLLYLFARSGAFPRLDEQAGEVASSASLWELVATWFVAAFERVLRQDLVRDYEEATDDLWAARGRIEPGRTTYLYYAGRVELACRFDECAFDTPLNRMLRAATRMVVSSPLLRPERRRRARRLEDHLADVGDVRRDDLLASTDRRTAHFADAITRRGIYLTLAGDGRGFNGSCLRSRMCMVIDLERNVATVKIRPSCKRSTEPRECVDAKIIGGMYNNNIEFRESKGFMFWKFDLHQSIYWISAALDANIRSVARNFDNGTGWPRPGIRLFGDGFPSTELYYRDEKGRNWIYTQRKEGSPIDLGPVVGDWSQEYTWP